MRTIGGLLTGTILEHTGVADLRDLVARVFQILQRVRCATPSIHIRNKQKQVIAVSVVALSLQQTIVHRLITSGQAETTARFDQWCCRKADNNNGDLDDARKPTSNNGNRRQTNNKQQQTNNGRKNRAYAQLLARDRDARTRASWSDGTT